ncbi:catecholate siderophore receptor Fiu [Nevskia ramosa]|uniref:catecholate siderophore receptor Fiu n=1 Tax=Nevskia ramosa TaxID=64002 RepID=UPI0003B65312|nr:catecholate siderophore receptor Fiu [Nevskia ramosa]
MSSPLFRLSPIAAAVLAFHAGPAAAQTAPAEPATTLPTVKVEDSAAGGIKADKVSSPKFTQPLLDTPQTISVVKKELMKQQGALTLSDALRLTPGITFQQGENGNTTSGDAVFLRGFDSQGSIFVDNIRDISPATRDLFNLEQVEIVKGPAGADNGRGVASGYINLVSKTPFADDAIGGSLAYGTRDRRRGTVDVNRKITDDIAVRLNVVGQDGGVAGRDKVESQRWGVAPSIAFGLGTPTRITLFTQHIFHDNVPDGGVVSVGVSGWRNPTLDSPETNPNGVVAERVDSSNFYGLDTDYENIDVNTYTGRFEHDIKPGYTVTNTSRYSRASQWRVLTAPSGAPTFGDVNDPSTWTVGRSRQGIVRHNELLTNQTNLRGSLTTGVIKHDFASGFEFIQESQSQPTYAVTATTPAQVQQRADVYNPNASDPGVDLSYNGAYTDGRTQTGAAYLNDTAKFGERDQFQLSGSLRFERYRTETEAGTLSTAAANPGVTPVGTLLGSRLTKSGTLVTYKAGGLWKPLPNGSVYASYGTSKRPPSGDNFALSATTTNINSTALAPSKADSVEVGTKWDLLDNKLAVTGALFRTESKNDIARQSGNEIVQYGKRRIQGVELGVVGNLTEAWQLSAGYTFQDAKVSEGTIATDGTSTQSGAAVNFSPKNSITTWTSYKLPLAFGPITGPLTIGGGLRYIDSQARTINNNLGSVTTGVVKVEDYFVVDAVVSYEVTANLGLQANIYNLLDEDYVGAVNNNGQRYQPSIPRSFLLALNFTY